MRQYDPAIARWTSIDPVTHWSNSTYNAFDNNPVFFADPSGADSEPSNQTDIFGRSVYDEYGNYIRASERGIANSSNTDPKPILKVNGENIDFNTYKSNSIFGGLSLSEVSDEEIEEILNDLVVFHKNISLGIDAILYVTGSYSAESLKELNPFQDWKDFKKSIKKFKKKKTRRKILKKFKKNAKNAKISPLAIVGTYLKMIHGQNADLRTNGWAEILVKYAYYHKKTNYKGSEGIYIVNEVIVSPGAPRMGIPTTTKVKLHVYDKKTKKILGTIHTIN